MFAVKVAIVAICIFDARSSYVVWPFLCLEKRYRLLALQLGASSASRPCLGNVVSSNVS